MEYILIYFGLFLIFFFHELGHYLVARRVGFTVESFTIGCGPKLLTIQRKETKFCLKLLPIGGICNISEFDSSEDEIIPKKEIRKHNLKKMAVVIAGPIMSGALSFLLMISSQNVEGLMIENLNSSVLKEEGIQKGDIIRSINGTRVFHREDIEYLLQEEAVNVFTIQKITRDRVDYKIYYAGEELEIDFDSSIKNRICGSINMFIDVLGVMTELFSDTLTGETSVIEDITEPTNDSVNVSMGMRYNLNKCIIVLSVFSLSICFFNLLPIIMFDGFRFIVCFLELLKGKTFGKTENIVIGILGIIISILSTEIPAGY